MNNDPYNTADDQPAADRIEMMSDDPHNEFDAHRALVAGRVMTKFYNSCDRAFGPRVTGEKNAS